MSLEDGVYFEEKEAEGDTKLEVVVYDNEVSFDVTHPELMTEEVFLEKQNAIDVAKRILELYEE